MSKISKHPPGDVKFKSFGDHQKYLTRITKTLYYGRLPSTESLSIPVTELAAELFSEPQKGKSLERLHYHDAAKISRNACVSPCSFVLAMLYLERLKKCNPEYLQKTAPHDLFLVSLMVSNKFLFDNGESDEVFMDEWAYSGGISVKEMISLEKEFLNAIDWEVYVSELAFWQKLNELETTLARKQGCTRGFFTYTELQSLSTIIDVQNIIQCITSVSIILAATYTVGLLTIVGSVFLASQIPGTSLYQPTSIEKQPSSDVSVELQRQIPNDFTETLIDLPEKTDSMQKRNKSMDVVDVLKTGILLASICDVDNNTVEQTPEAVAWDWWNVPIMTWLSDTAKSLLNLDSYTNIDMNRKFMFLENVMHNEKEIALVVMDNMADKATKTRIQDQIERNWHEEWTDTIKNSLFHKVIAYSHYFNYIKS